MSIIGEVREAYATVGIRLAEPAAYGTYYRLLCAACGRAVGNVGDQLLPGLARELVLGQFELYATGLLGCVCGHQQHVTRTLDPARWASAQDRACGEASS